MMPASVPSLERNLKFDDFRKAISRSTALVEFSADGHILFANPNFLALMHYREDEVIGRHHSMFVRSEEKEDPQYRAFWELLRAGEFVRREFCRVSSDGREVWLQASYNPIIDASGKTRSILKLATDITAEKQRAANHESMLSAISRSTAMVEFAMNGTILTANDIFAALMGYDVADLLGRHHREFLAPDVAESVAYQNFWNRLRSGEFVESEFSRISKSGAVVWLQASYNPICDASGRPLKVMKIATDITARMKQSAATARLALVDQLTGVSNRRGFDIALTDMLTDAGRKRAPLSLLMLDVDHFKHFNDTYGHQLGDSCLRVIAKAIEVGVRQRPGTLVSRYGGEEFAILLAGTSRTEAAIIAEGIREEIASLAIDHQGNPSWQAVTASIGTATLDPNRTEATSRAAERLVAAADEALYAAKDHGRNRVVAATERLSEPSAPEHLAAPWWLTETPPTGRPAATEAADPGCLAAIPQPRRK